LFVLIFGVDFLTLDYTNGYINLLRGIFKMSNDLYMDQPPLNREEKSPQGSRDNKSKPQLSFILDAPNACEGLAKRFEIGCDKYGRNNWKKGLNWVELIDSMQRHILAFQNGEDIDPEDGQPHVWAIAWNVIILVEMFHTRKDLDTRYKPDFIVEELEKQSD